MAKICPKCGNQLKDKSTFCGKCGAVWEDKSADAKKKPIPKNPAAFIKAYKKPLIGVCALLAAVALLLVIVNPANSPKAVFGRYLDCMRSLNAEQYSAISYDANFSSVSTAEDAVSIYKSRFTSADPSYKSGGKVDLLKDTEIRIIKEETPKQTEIASRRNALAANYRNTARITDIRNITFEVKKGDLTSTGTAELICVTGKWYIADVLGI